VCEGYRHQDSESLEDDAADVSTRCAAQRQRLIARAPIAPFGLSG
jgi:hypothetical protein